MGLERNAIWTIRGLQNEIGFGVDTRTAMRKKAGGKGLDQPLADGEVLSLLDGLCKPSANWKADKADAAKRIFGLVSGQTATDTVSNPVVSNPKPEQTPVSKPNQTDAIKPKTKPANPIQPNQTVSDLNQQIGTLKSEIVVLNDAVSKLQTVNSNLQKKWFNRLGPVEAISFLGMTAMVFSGISLLGWLGGFLGFLGALFCMWSLINFRKSLSRGYQVFNIIVCALVELAFSLCHYANALDYLEGNQLAEKVKFTDHDMAVGVAVFSFCILIAAIISNYASREQ